VATFVGQNISSCQTTCTTGIAVATDVSNATGNNVQDGSNTFPGSQNATANTGDGVAGQVLGVVSAGAASVDATNHTDDSSVQTGDSSATNDASIFVGLNVASSTATTTVRVGDISGVTANNLQDGANRKTLDQTADASSGDGVAGQVTGVVTSAGGSASVVLANNSSGISAATGESGFDNRDASFVGLSVLPGPLTIG